MVYDDLSAGHREAVLGAPLVEADLHDVDTLRRTLREHEVGAVRASPRRADAPAVLVAGSEKVQRTLRWRAKHSTLIDIVDTA